MARWATKTVEQRFWEKVALTANQDKCWLWTASKRQLSGYGHFNPTYGKSALAHRIAWALVNGPIPEGKVIDHICRVRHCVNPNHLRICTNRENLNAPGSLVNVRNWGKTECKWGHPFTPENTRIGHHGARQCRICERRRKRVRKRNGVIN